MIEGLTIGVVIPAYNEAASLEKLLPRIPSDLCDLVVVVSDGCQVRCGHEMGKIGRIIARGPAAP